MRLLPTHRLTARLFFLALLFTAGIVTVPAAPHKTTPTPAAPVQPPPDPLVVEALPLLQSGYLGFASLKATPTDRWADLLTRAAGGFDIVPTPAIPSPIVTTLLPGHIIYWRLASFTPEKGWPALIAETRQWVAQGAVGLVLDLRSSTDLNDLAGATQVAGLVVPTNGTPIFTAGTVSPPAPSSPAVNLPLAVLINEGTRGASEALANWLQAHGAVFVGKATAGQAALFDERKLASGAILRYAATPIRWGDNSVTAVPLTPDLPVEVNDQQEQNALALIARRDVADVVQEPAGRRRLNEAALVAGEDPEYDNYLASREEGAHLRLSTVAATQDAALIHALDALKAIRLAQRVVEPPPSAR